MRPEIEQFYQRHYQAEENRLLSGVQKPGVDLTGVISQFVHKTPGTEHLLPLPASEALNALVEFKASKKASSALQAEIDRITEVVLARKGVAALDVRVKKGPDGYARMSWNIGEKHWGEKLSPIPLDALLSKPLTKEGKLPVEEIIASAHPKGVLPLSDSQLFKDKFPNGVEAGQSLWEIFQRFIGSKSKVKQKFAQPVQEKMEWYQHHNLPIELVLMLSLENFASPLKEFSHLPDLADVGQLLKFHRLNQAISAVYPPGIKFIIVNESPAFLGFAADQKSRRAQLEEYKSRFAHLCETLGLGGVVDIVDMDRVFEGRSSGKFEQALESSQPTAEELALFTKVEFTNVDIKKVLTPEEISALTVADLLAIYSGEYSVAGFQIEDVGQMTAIQVRVFGKIFKQAMVQAEFCRRYHAARSRVEQEYLQEQGVVQGPYIKISCVNQPDKLFFPLSDDRMLPQHGVGILTRQGKIKVAPVVVPFLEPHKYLLVDDPVFRIKYFKEVL